MKKTTYNIPLSKKVEVVTQRKLESSLRVNEFMKMMGKEFSHGQKLTMGDLVSDPSFGTAAILLNHCVSGEVKFERTNHFFCWKDTSKYAPQQIMFAVDNSTRVHYDSRGYLCNPFFHYGITVSTVNQHYNLHLGEGPCFIAPIKLMRHTVDLCMVKPATVKDAHAYLLCKQWGGPMRWPRQDAFKVSEVCTDDNGVLFHISSASKGGKEGMDYYILSKGNDLELQSFNEMMAKMEEERMSKIVYPDQLKFAKKLEKVAEIKELRENMPTRENPETRARVKELSDRCESNPVAKLPFVQTPNVDLEFLATTISLDSMLDWTLEEIEREKVRNLEKASVEQTLARLEHMVAKWEKFAPAYAAQKHKIDALDGDMVVYGDYAQITLPSNEELGKTDVIEGPFSSVQFTLVLGELESRQKLHDEAEAKIRAAKADLQQFLA